MKSHGEGHDERMLKLAMISSKFSVIVMAFFSVPLVIEMAFVMNVWLINPPDYTVELCNWILILSLLSQYSIGLMNSISATGQIKKYQLVMSVLILLNVPISYVLLKLGYPPYFCTIGFVLIELISLVVRIIMAHSIVGINIKDFIGKVIKPTIICITLSFLPAYAVHFFLPYGILRTIIVFISFMTIFLITAWLIALEEYEKKVILNLMYKIKSIVK